eukprot:TRINITY_DN8748_c0_g1_i1.p1 TRINITY_DN8748_c0_g1~~TRINITY_DN8748_c0_g1_i1.p1  ORF type:complete len:334 (+),score=70.04 TRINITY_DN8748_c0_g1_i1:114-1115(+)
MNEKESRRVAFYVPHELSPPLVNETLIHNHETKESVIQDSVSISTSSTDHSNSECESLAKESKSNLVNLDGVDQSMLPLINPSAHNRNFVNQTSLEQYKRIAHWEYYLEEGEWELDPSAVVYLYRDVWGVVLSFLLNDSSSYRIRKKRWNITRSVCKEWNRLSDFVFRLNLKMEDKSLVKKIENGDVQSVVFMVPRLRGYNPTKKRWSEEAYDFFAAASGGFHQIVALFLKDKRIKEDHCNKALLEASTKGHYETVKILMNDVRSDPSHSSNICIHNAAWINSFETVKILLEDPRVDPTGCEYNKMVRPMDYAIKYKNKEMKELFSKYKKEQE